VDYASAGHYNLERIMDIKKALDKIDIADEKYYNGDGSDISDQEYDGLKDYVKLFKKTFSPKTKADEDLLERINNCITRVGAPPPADGKWPKVRHLVSMSSLDKVNLPEELTKWWKDKGSEELFASEKLDGISISLKYSGGKLIQAGTRGDGIEGEDIISNVRRMKNISINLNDDFTGYIRGEIIMCLSDKDKYFPEMKSVRNGAAGVAKRLYGTGCENLTVLCYTIEGKDFNNEVEAFEYINKVGLKTPNYFVVKNAKEAVDLWNEYMGSKRKLLDYDIDGLVVRINDKKKFNAAGFNSNAPDGARAFKFEAPEASTTITKIVSQVGDTGRITPVAKFNKVFLLGAEIEACSLHNFSIVTALKVDVGAEVIITRNNDVIPGLKEVTKGTGTIFVAPDNCPECGAPTDWVGEYLICTNKATCPAQVIGRLNKWIKELNILEWGEAVLKKLIASGLVSDVADLYKLSVSDIESLDRMGKKSAQNLIAELDKFREVPLENFIGGLTIEGVATSSVKQLISAGYSSLDDILALSVKEIENVPGFGGTRALNIVNGLKENAKRIKDILDAGVSIKKRIDGRLNGKSFCFTGAMSQPRPKLERLVTDSGGEVKSSVGGGLTYLVISDPSSTSSKAVKAKKLGVKLISEDEFLKML
jgi:DNA ligase (NAD+)